MRTRRLPGILLLLCLLLSALPAYGAETDVGRQPISVTRITSDGILKDGAAISADGSMVAWFQQGEGYSDLLLVAPADGSAAPRTVLATDAKTDYIYGLQGPKYTAGDTRYYVTLYTQHISISADGGTLAVAGIEHFDGGWLYGWIVVSTRTGSARYVGESYPAGMGVRAYNTYGGAQSIGDGHFALSGDGSTILFVADGFAESATREILVALDIASGQAKRVAGYSSLSVQSVSESDPQGCCTGPWVSPTGTKVAFSTYYNWETNLYAGDFGPAASAPKRVETLQVGSTPGFTAAGEYLVARFPGLATSTFWPTAGGDPIQVEHRDVFTIPFYDGKVGLIEVPIWASNTQEIRVVRPDGAAVMLKPGERGLPSGWTFGVPALSSGFRWALADAYGNKVLLPLMSADGKSQDLYVLNLSATTPTPTTPPTTTTPSATEAGAAVTITWDPVSPTPAGYKIFRSITGPGDYDPSWPLTDFPMKETTYTDTGLEPGTYYYTILPIYRQATGEVAGTPISRTVVAKAQTKIVLQMNATSAKVGDKTLTLDVPPFIQNGRTLVPLRFIGEQLGAAIAWEQSEQRVTYTKGNTVIQLWIGRQEALVNGQPVRLDVPAQIVNDRTVVPLRFVAQALGATTDWNGETSEVTITPQ